MNTVFPPSSLCFVTKSPVQSNINEISFARICVHFHLAFILCLFSFSFIDFKEIKIDDF